MLGVGAYIGRRTVFRCSGVFDSGEQAGAEGGKERGLAVHSARHVLLRIAAFADSNHLHGCLLQLAFHEVLPP